MEKDLNKYKDSYGFIGHIMPNGKLEFGDGWQRSFTRDICLYEENPNPDSVESKVVLCLRVTIEDDMKKLQPVRHWDKSAWPGQLWIMSRDNLLPGLRALALYAVHSPAIERLLVRLMDEIDKRHGLLWNYKHIWPKDTDEPKLPDFLHWFTRAEIKIRAYRRLRDYFLLHICDMDGLINSVLIVVRSWRKPNQTSDDLNFINWLFHGQMVMPTINIFLAKWIYKLFRRRPTLEGLSKHKATAVFEAYYYGEYAPPMDKVCKNLLVKYV